MKFFVAQGIIFFEGLRPTSLECPGRVPSCDIHNAHDPHTVFAYRHEFDTTRLTQVCLDVDELAVVVASFGLSRVHVFSVAHRFLTIGHLCTCDPLGLRSSGA